MLQLSTAQLQSPAGSRAAAISGVCCRFRASRSFCGNLIFDACGGNSVSMLYHNRVHAHADLIASTTVVLHEISEVSSYGSLLSTISLWLISTSYTCATDNTIRRNEHGRSEPELPIRCNTVGASVGECEGWPPRGSSSRLLRVSQ